MNTCLNDIVKIANSWTSAHKGYFKSGARVPFIAGKNTSQTSSQSSLSQQVSLKVIKLPTTQVIELLAMVVVSLVTFAETAHQTQVISKLVRVTHQKMLNFVWMIKIHENSCAVDLLMLHLLYVDILVVVVLLFPIPFYLMPLLQMSLFVVTK